MKFLSSIILFILSLAIFTQCKSGTSNQESSTNYSDTPIKPVTEMKPDKPVAFGYKCMWLAVKTDNAEKVANIIGLKTKNICNWAVGINKAYDGKIFVSPVVHGWTFAVGWGLPHGDTNESIDSVKLILNNLSREFGEAQFFATHRVVSFVCWIKSINGNTTRVYSYADGENILVEGEPTGIEKKMNLINTLSPEAKDPKYFDRSDLVMPDEEEVMQVADSWSTDPTKLEELEDIPPGLGILGER